MFIPLLVFDRGYIQPLKIKILICIKDFISGPNICNQSKEHILKHINEHMFHQNLSEIDGFMVNQILQCSRNRKKMMFFARIVKKKLITEF